jgi:RND family efflux transporter MFP subunit
MDKKPTPTKSSATYGFSGMINNLVWVLKWLLSCLPLKSGSSFFGGEKPEKPSTKALAAFAVAACALYLVYQGYQRSMAAKRLAEETLGGSSLNVAITFARPGPTSETIVLPGNIDAWYRAPIYAQVSGYVKMWYKDYGAIVNKGDILAEINAPIIDAQYAQAKASLESQRAKYNLAVVTANRYLALRKSHAVSEQSISVQEASQKSELAEFQASQHNVDNFIAQERFKTIVAPFEGVVIARNINVGDYINKEGNISDQRATTELFAVADIHKMRLFISVPETFAQVLKPGLEAEVTVPQYPNRRFVAKFLTTANGFDPLTRTAITEFTIDNEKGDLWPGSYGAVSVSVPLNPNTLIIPTSALVFQEAGTEVAIVDQEGKVHFSSIKVGRIMDGFVEVVGGVTKFDRIIQSPSAALLEGDHVNIVIPAPGYEDKTLNHVEKK